METKYIDVGGIRTRYLEAGTGEPLLLVHGGQFGSPTFANHWDLTVEKFGRAFHVFAIDKIGSGFTDNPVNDHEYVIGTTVRHVFDFLKTMKLDRVHVAGHSRGGYVVCRLALEHPEMVKTVVIVSSATLMAPSTGIYQHWHKRAARIEDIRERHHYIAAANSFTDEHVTEDFVDVMVEAAMLPKTKEAAEKMKGGLRAQFYQDLDARRKETQEWVRAGGIKAPTLIMWGLNDVAAKFDPVGLGALDLIFSSTPKSQMHILNQAGHYCFRDQPEAFAAAVASFIKLNA